MVRETEKHRDSVRLQIQPDSGKEVERQSERGGGGGEEGTQEETQAVEGK